MKNWWSVLACTLVIIVFTGYRISYSSGADGKATILTQWDGLGYYMYLPSALIYDDFTELKWIDSMDRTYRVTGGNLYQSNVHSNGNYVNKYFGGVAILQMPLFAVGHLYALNSTYPEDGFSAPYQYALGYGVLIYCLLALLVLRKILLRYYAMIDPLR